MDKMLNILANLSPVIIAVLASAVFLMIRYNKEIRGMFFAFVLFVYLTLFYFELIVRANTESVILSCALAGLISPIVLLFYFKDYNSVHKTICLLTFAFVTVFSNFLCIYRTIKKENLIKTEIIDKLHMNIFKIDYSAYVLKIVENEWFKGITIAATGGAIGTIIAEKIKNRKK